MARLRLIQIVWPGFFALLCLYALLLQPFALAAAISGAYFGLHALIAAVGFRRSPLARRTCLVMTTLNLVAYSAILMWFLYLQVDSGDFLRNPMLTVFFLAVLGIGMWVLLSWVIPFFLITGWFEVKFPRYLLPIYPLMILWAADWLLRELPSHLGPLVSLRNPAAHSAALSCDAVARQREAVLGIGCEGLIVRLARVKGRAVM